MESTKKIGCMSIAINSRPGDEFSMAVHTIGGNAIFNSHRVLRLIIWKDGSLFLTMLKIAGMDKSCKVGRASFEEEMLTRDFDLGMMNALGEVVTPKFSFHPSGAINIGDHRIYRPPLRTINSLEQLCLIQYGNPVDLPAINMAEFNAWNDTKGHPLITLGTPLPAGVLATRMFVAGPSEFNSLKNIVCSDFDHVQLNYIFQIRGLGDEFPLSKSGDHGYDLLIATSCWHSEKWKGPVILIPATNPSDNPETARKNHDKRMHLPMRS